jgi:hypothetical protein
MHSRSHMWSTLLYLSVSLVPVDAARAKDCAKAGQICFFPGDAQTAFVAPNTLTRAARVASKSGGAAADRKQAWQLQLVAQLKQKSLTGTVMVVVYDRADPQAIANREVTALWDFKTVGAKLLGVHASLDPEDGFLAGHTYLFRVTQILGKREVVLAEGDIKLE